jgi:GMP synthase (glutamine-hydrolysing)
MLRFLVVEGNTLEGRTRHAAARGQMPSESYGRVLNELAADASVDICYPADTGANLPDAGGLEAYDGVVITGSALHIYHLTPEITQQIDLIRTAFTSGTPIFGSCWGAQLITVAGGGTVHKNPRGREFGFARKITPNEMGRGHPLLAGRPVAFDAPAVHLDEVAVPAQGTIVLASNEVSPVQAIELKVGASTAWAVQYHPEFSFSEVASIGGQIGQNLINEGFFDTLDDLARWRSDLERLHADPTDGVVAWRQALDTEVTDTHKRRREIANFIDYLVRPTKSERGRA